MGHFTRIHLSKYCPAWSSSGFTQVHLSPHLSFLKHHHHTICECHIKLTSTLCISTAGAETRSNESQSEGNPKLNTLHVGQQRLPVRRRHHCHATVKYCMVLLVLFHVVIRSANQPILLHVRCFFNSQGRLQSVMDGLSNLMAFEMNQSRQNLVGSVAWTHNLCSGRCARQILHCKL